MIKFPHEIPYKFFIDSLKGCQVQGVSATLLHCFTCCRILGAGGPMEVLHVEVALLPVVRCAALESSRDRQPFKENRQPFKENRRIS